jgi:hypothetical protein
MWYYYLSYFFGGAFLMNSVPHLVNGVSGRSFPTPFAKPPGKGLSPPVVNAFWGALNLVVGYFLVFHVGDFSLRDIPYVLVVGAGGLVLGIMLALNFQKSAAGG